MVPTYPSLAERLQSVFADMVFVIIMMFAAAALLDKMQNPPDWIRIALFFGIWGLYEPLCISLGCTLGQFIIGLRVRAAANPDKRIIFPMAFIRYVVKMILGWLAFLTISSNAERRAIHDFAAGSVMIRVKRK